MAIKDIVEYVGNVYRSVYQVIIYSHGRATSLHTFPSLPLLSVIPNTQHRLMMCSTALNLVYNDNKIMIIKNQIRTIKVTIKNNDNNIGM